MPRIVSLIPSATEIAAALGFQAELVGRSHECDYPPGVEQLPALTAPKFELGGTSREIDQRVKAVLQDALSVYRVDERLLADLRPDVILTQAQCEVCAVSLEEVERVTAACLITPAQLVSLEPNTLDDVLADIIRVADALGVPERGAALVAEMRARMNAVAAQVADELRPTVALIEWIDPPMAAGNWMPELVEKAGGINLFGEAGKHSPWLAWDDVRAADPEIIVVLPCGFDVERALQDMTALEMQPGWADLRAVQAGRVYIADGNQYFNRPGPRLAESVEILAEMFHPTAADYGHAGRGWIVYQPQHTLITQD